MSYTIQTILTGRIGNQLFRNLVVNFIAEKFDLYVEYSNNDFFKNMGINLYCGKNKFDKTELLTDDNYFSIYNAETLNYNLDSNHNFFQTYELTRIIYNHLNSEKIKSNIIDKNHFKNRYNNNNDLFVHVRLDDFKHLMPKFNFFIDTIKKIKYDNLYISTDEQSSKYISDLINIFPEAQLFLQNEFITIQFASTCKNIILSGGTFSCFIAYLAFYSTIYYPINELNKRQDDVIFIKENNNWIEVNY